MKPDKFDDFVPLIAMLILILFAGASALIWGYAIKVIHPYIDYFGGWDVPVLAGICTYFISWKLFKKMFDL